MDDRTDLEVFKTFCNALIKKCEALVEEAYREDNVNSDNSPYSYDDDVYDDYSYYSNDRDLDDYYPITFAFTTDETRMMYDNIAFYDKMKLLAASKAIKADVHSYFINFYQMFFQNRTIDWGTICSFDPNDTEEKQKTLFSYFENAFNMNNTSGLTLKEVLEQWIIDLS